MDSHANYSLQADDLFCWGIFKKYEAGNTEWYEVFKSKIKYEKLLALEMKNERAL